MLSLDEVKGSGAEATFKSVYDRRFSLIRVSNTGLDLPEDTYILISPALLKILFDRSLVGWDLQYEVFRASRAMFESLKDGLMKDYPPMDRFEQVNLAGSDGYQLQSAHAVVFNDSLPRNYIAIKRREVPGEKDERGKQRFETDVMYTRFEASGKLCILPETIATGQSACDSIDVHFPQAIKRGLETMLVWSIAGSKNGAERLHKKIRGYGVRAFFVFGMGLFGLGDDGTALLWRKDENGDGPITLPEFEKIGKEVYAPGECNIGDWGERFSDPVGYLRGWKKELERLGCPEKFRVPERYKNLV